MAPCLPQTFAWLQWSEENQSAIMRSGRVDPSKIGVLRYFAFSTFTVIEHRYEIVATIWSCVGRHPGRGPDRCQCELDDCRSSAVQWDEIESRRVPRTRDLVRPRRGGEGVAEERRHARPESARQGRIGHVEC